MALTVNSHFVENHKVDQNKVVDHFIKTTYGVFYL